MRNFRSPIKTWWRRVYSKFLYSHLVEPVLFALNRELGRVSVGVLRPALSWAMCLRKSSNCWLHLWFCSRRCWFCASSSRNLLVTHSLMRAAFASTCRASCSLNWRCNKEKCCFEVKTCPAQSIFEKLPKYKTLSKM